MEKYDLIVIGGGSGLDVASAYKSRDKKVAVIEPGPLGGTCLNRGCIPSKMLIHRADILKEIKNSEKFNISANVDQIRFKEMIDEVNSQVSREAEQIEESIKQTEDYDLYKAKAEFKSEKIIKVNDKEIEGEKIILAAGTRPLIPPVSGLDEVDYLTSKEALKLDKKPSELIIIGGGYIAAELAYFYGSLGTKITIIEMNDRLIGREDKEISKKFTELFSNNYNVQTGLKASNVNEKDGKIVLEAENKKGKVKEFEGDEILVAAGRIPNTDNLKVEEANIETDDRGFVQTDEYMQTSQKHIYALGDIAGNYLFKHSANLEAEFAFKNSYAGNKFEIDYSAMPHAIFSEPQIAGVGMTEQELEEKDSSYISAKYNYKDTGMGMALKEENGFVKVYADPETEEILGCHIMGPEAATMIHEVLVSMRGQNGKVSDIKETIHIHPAINEVLQRAFQKL